MTDTVPAADPETGREIYFISGSPPCWSVMLAMAVKGVAYTPRRLGNSAREQKAPEFLAVNPRGHVPVLVDGDTIVCETLAILAYLDAGYPDAPLFGATPIETARIWQTICDADAHLRGPVGDLSRPLFRGKAEEFADKISDHAATVRGELDPLETRLSDATWLAGSALTAADLIVYPIVMQLLRAAARDDAAPLNLGVSPLGEHFPALGRWCARIEALPGYDDAYPPHWK